MIRPYAKAALTGGVHGSKAVTLQDMDNFLDWLVDGEGKAKSPQELYKIVAWVFWCVNRRANAVAGMPYLVMPLGVEEDDPELAVEWGIELRPTLWAVEAWICLKGAAYVLKRMAGSALDKLQPLNANTMRVLTYDDDGPTSFEQRIGTKRTVYQADELLYFRTFNPNDDIREGITAGAVSRKPATLVNAINDYASAFFENGAIPAVLLTTQEAIPPGERERVLNAWQKLLRGVQRAFSTAVLERGLTPTVIGQPNADLAMPELDDSKRDQILAAHLLPPGLAKSVTSRAEREALQLEAYTECYIPELENRIEPVLNDQLFNDLGLRISFQYDTIEVMQRQEFEKAQSSALFVNQLMLPALAAKTVSVDEVRAVITSVLEAASLPPLNETFEPPADRTPPQLRPFTGQPMPDEDESGEDEGEEQNAEPESAPPKASAPVWGRLKVSLPN